MGKNIIESVRKLADEIFDEIIVPVCSVSGITINMYHAKFSDYDRGDPKDRKTILDKVIQKYGVDRNGLEPMQDYPFALIALYIIEKADQTEE